MTPLHRTDIARIAVYPPVGIARIGNAPDGYLVTTEVIGGMPTRPDGTAAAALRDFRDDTGAVIPHAARFRVYATLRDGSVRELTLDDGIATEWRVTLANLKAGWYCFNQAMDLPPRFAKPAARRNPTVTGADRAGLDICPAARRIAGANRSGAGYRFDDGRFLGKPVCLGEIRTDPSGRLLVLGGVGASASAGGAKPETYANNDGWHDDVADGPVRATVRLADGSVLEAEPGWVAVTPPNNAPGLIGLVTLDDTVREVFHDAGWLPRPTATGFTADVWPVFARLTDAQWVNHGLFVLHGAGGALDAHDPAAIARLSDMSAAAAGWRQAVLALFRRPADALKPDRGALPQLYGDAEGEMEPATDCLAVTRTQYEHLVRWAEGHAASDWPGAPAPSVAFDALTPADQVRHLERASLTDCLGGPFHPGIELTWTTRIRSVWRDAYRPNVLPGDAPARQDWGERLEPATCIGAGGPYDGLAPGALTRFMGVPWQTDGASCNSGADYRPSYFLSTPSFWGPRVPDQVLSAQSHARLLANVALGKPAQAAKHFGTRSDWLRDVRGQGYLDRIDLMVREWHDLGMILPIESPAATGYPTTMWVEQGRAAEYTLGDVKPALVEAVETLAGPLPPQPSAKVPPLRLGATPPGAAPPGTAEQTPRRRYRHGDI